MSLKVKIPYAVGRLGGVNVGALHPEEFPVQTIEISYDGTIGGFDYDYELAFAAMSGMRRDDRFEFVEAFIQGNFHGLLGISPYRRYFCEALAEQGLKAFVGDTVISRTEEMDLLVAILWFVHDYAYASGDEAPDWVMRRIEEIAKPNNDLADLSFTVSDAHTDEPFTNLVKIDYELAINGTRVASFVRFARKSTYDPVEAETRFEVEDIEYMSSYVWKLIKIFDVAIPDGIDPDDIEDPITFKTNDTGEFFVLYTDSEDEVSLDSAVKVRRFLDKHDALSAIETFMSMTENLDPFERTQHKVTLARLGAPLRPGAEVQAEDLVLIRTWFYKKRREYFGDWESTYYDDNAPVRHDHTDNEDDE